jgi:anti-sigma regulatory factor (Ser/Thr protein kinase)/serine/threonine protein phosphatase PrpC
VITGQRLLCGGLPVAVSVEQEQDLGAVGKLAVAAADAQGFDLTDMQRARQVASEMAANVRRSAREGRISVRLVECGEFKGVELVATDHGTGVAVPGSRSASTDATVHAPVGDLGVIARGSDLFDLYAAPGRGTVMMSRLWGARAVPATGDRFLVGSMLEPIAGEEVSGDGWAVEQSGNRVVALVADGLGHGVVAAAASEAAVTAFRRRYRESVEDIVGYIHRALRGTRGAAIAVAEIDSEVGRLRLCGIGNITARLLVGGAEKNLISHFGIAGYQTPRIRAYQETWEDEALLVMHSDGLSSSWDLSRYPGLLGHQPQLVAATVMRDAVRANDDALVLVLRDTHEASGAKIVAAR